MSSTRTAFTAFGLLLILIVAAAQPRAEVVERAVTRAFDRDLRADVLAGGRQTAFLDRLPRRDTFGTVVRKSENSARAGTDA